MYTRKQVEKRRKKNSFSAFFSSFLALHTHVLRMLTEYTKKAAWPCLTKFLLVFFLLLFRKTNTPSRRLTKNKRTFSHLIIIII